MMLEGIEIGRVECLSDHYFKYDKAVFGGNGGDEEQQ